MKKLIPLLLLVGCASVDPIPSIEAVVETVAVASTGDAADDPAIWVNHGMPAESIVLGTDKQAGLYLYDLSGAVKQFLPAGRLNNVDLRQGVTIGAFSGDIAAASNRTDNSITLFAIENGKARETGRIASSLVEPYGACMGRADDGVFAFVAYKTGDLVAYRLMGPDGGAEIARFKLASQLEGCVMDDAAGVLYVGEEARGIWKATFDGNAFGVPVLIDEMRGASGMKADVEGLALYKAPAGGGYLVASSQGNNSYTIYKRDGENAFLVRFAVTAGAAVDGTEETDGIAVTSSPLGPQFPRGAMIIQDGFNDGADTQNFKYVDWRAIDALIGAASAD